MRCLGEDCGMLEEDSRDNNGKPFGEAAQTATLGTRHVVCRRCWWRYLWVYQEQMSQFVAICYHSEQPPNDRMLQLTAILLDPFKQKRTAVLRLLDI